MGWTKRCFLRQHDKGGGNQPSKGLEPFEGWVVLGKSVGFLMIEELIKEMLPASA